jgi:hypothetical protein
MEILKYFGNSVSFLYQQAVKRDKIDNNNIVLCKCMGAGALRQLTFFLGLLARRGEDWKIFVSGTTLKVFCLACSWCIFNHGVSCIE